MIFFEFLNNVTWNLRIQNLVFLIFSEFEKLKIVCILNELS